MQWTIARFQEITSITLVDKLYILIFFFSKFLIFIYCNLKAINITPYLYTKVDFKFNYGIQFKRNALSGYLHNTIDGFTQDVI